VGIGMRRLFVPFAALLVAAAFSTTSLAGSLTAEDKRLARAAFAAIEQEHWAQAKTIIARVKNPLARKMVDWLDLRQAGVGRPFADYVAFLAANPAWPNHWTVRSQAEHAMPDDLPDAAVLKFFEKHDPNTIGGVMRMAAALNAGGQTVRATALLRQGWVEMDFSDADEQQFLALYRQSLRPEDDIRRLDRLLWEEKRDQARRLLPRVDDGHRQLALARLSLMAEAPTDAAVAAVPAALLKDPGLIFDRARWHRRMGQYDKAVALLDPPPAAVARPEILWPELEDAARRALLRGDISVAYRLAEAHGVATNANFADGEWLAGWIALRFLREKQAGYQHFTRLYGGVTAGLSKSRGAYWAGRAAEDMGDKAKALEWYGLAAGYMTTYYGQLAAHRLGTDAALRFPPMPQASKADAAEFNRRELVRVVRLLDEIDQANRARPFLSRLVEQATSPTEFRLIADLANELGREYAISVAKQARQKGVELFDYLFPLRAVPRGVGPEAELVLAVIRQESGFAPDAVSPAGAMGLMQLMPSTAAQLARQMKIKKFDKKRLTKDPGFNLTLGRAYLGQMVERFDGSYVLAVASYNAGAARVAGWVRLYGDPRDKSTDVVDWIETIPFNETRNYVLRVMENLQVYRHRLGHTHEPELQLAQDLARGAQP
jgi:soluble lytic murein transglycosylase